MAALALFFRKNKINLFVWDFLSNFEGVNLNIVYLYLKIRL